MTRRLPCSSADCIRKPYSAWPADVRFPTTEWGSTIAIVPVNCPHGLCYIRDARFTRLLLTERRFNEQAISKRLPVPRITKGWPGCLGVSLSGRTEQPEGNHRHRGAVHDAKDRNDSLRTTPRKHQPGNQNAKDCRRTGDPLHRQGTVSRWQQGVQHAGSLRKLHQDVGSPEVGTAITVRCSHGCRRSMARYIATRER